MDAYWYDKLLDTLMVQTNSENEKLMILYLDEKLRELKLPYFIDAAGNVIVTKGKAKTYPCVTSHMDTVHNFADNFVLYRDEEDKDLLFSMNNKKRVGIGGDDKCGVFACLYLLEMMPQIKVVFFSREERGCKGSTDIDKTFFNDCRYLIQLDRRGSRDFIQTYWGDKTISHDFSSEIGNTKKKYKYKNCVGSVTDVMKLWKNRVGISCINLSCGYYKPHTNYEYISVEALWNSIKFTEKIIKIMKPKKYASLPSAVKMIATTSYKSIYGQCCKCHKWKKEVLLYKVKGSKTNKSICWPCKKKQFYKGGQSDHNSVLTDGTIITFTCCECGIKASEMEAGDSLKYINGKQYCNGCASVFFVLDKEPEKCYVCNLIIPKDHKVIKRFGVRVCEDCSCPSDEVLLS